MLCFWINIQINTSSKWHITGGKISSISLSFPEKKCKELSEMWGHPHNSTIFCYTCPFKPQRRLCLAQQSFSFLEKQLLEVGKILKVRKKQKMRAIVVSNGHIVYSGQGLALDEGAKGNWKKIERKGERIISWIIFMRANKHFHAKFTFWSSEAMFSPNNPIQSYANKN